MISKEHCFLKNITVEYHLNQTTSTFKNFNASKLHKYNENGLLNQNFELIHLNFRNESVLSTNLPTLIYATEMLWNLFCFNYISGFYIAGTSLMSVYRKLNVQIKYIL